MSYRGLQLAQAVFQRAKLPLLGSMAPLFVGGLTKLLRQLVPGAQPPRGGADAAAAGAGAGAGAGGDGEAAGASATTTPVPAATAAAYLMRLREASYSALGHLGHRCPKAVSSKVDIPALLFARLSTEEPAMRLSIAETLSMIAPAYVLPMHVGCGFPPSYASLWWGMHSFEGAQGALRESLLQLLQTNASKVRLGGADAGTNSLPHVCAHPSRHVVGRRNPELAKPHWNGPTACFRSVGCQRGIWACCLQVMQGRRSVRLR